MSVGDDDMTMTDAALWLILIGILAIVPIGCVVTWPKKKTDEAKTAEKPAAEKPAAE